MHTLFYTFNRNLRNFLKFLYSLLFFNCNIIDIVVSGVQHNGSVFGYLEMITTIKYS